MLWLDQRAKETYSCFPDKCSARRFAARVPGRASGLALAVRPAGLAEVSRVKGGSRSRFCEAVLETTSGALDDGGASPDNARRSGPPPVTFTRLLRACRVPDGLAAAGGRATEGVRRGPRAAGHRGCRARPADAPVGLPPAGRGEAGRPATARPRLNPGRLRRTTLGRSFPLSCPRPVLAARGRGRQARRAGGAPLKP
jgi:hypothetical protein